MATFKVAGVGEFPWARDKLNLIEAIELEKATGWRVADLVADYNGYNDPSGNRGAMGLAAFLWLAMKRNGHIIPFAKLAEIDAGDIEIAYDDEEPAQPDPPAEPPARKTRSGSGPRKGSSPRK
ncbi:hypothetical protein [Saccharothrix variisporea]|uniref:Uncharacterized protein n=1 Tax=Saccharothrix variisporea TaxID=543527 RepID=A0A495X1P2_9PSEU|nr:hypothetical protein [Saccharothrix variisporea]RKT67114.1 hypothetical protein DFJ66_0282 [Saccharothrix variisporea]